MPANPRRKARVAALKALYAADVGKLEADDALKSALTTINISGAGRDFASQLVTGVLGNVAKIDAYILKFAIGYSVDRLAAIDRAALRVGAYELLYAKEVPPAIAINEAVELVKTFSTAESGSFVNGVLGAMLREAEQDG